MGGTVLATPPLELLELDELLEFEELLEDELLLDEDELLDEELPPGSGGVAPPHAVSSNELNTTPSIECVNPGRLPIGILTPHSFRTFRYFYGKKHPFKNQLRILTGVCR